MAGTALAGWQIYRYHTREQADPDRLGPATDPLTGAVAGGEDAAKPLPLPPVTRSLLLGAAVGAGMHGMALAVGPFARGLAARIRPAAPRPPPRPRGGGP